MIQIPERAIAIIHGYEGLAGGRSDNKFYPYHGFADAVQVMTIGRGHRINPGENYDAGLTLTQVNKLFCDDIQPRAQIVNGYFHNHSFTPKEHEFAGALSGFYNDEEIWTPGSKVFELFIAGKKLEAMQHLMLYHMSGKPLEPQLGLWRRRATEALCILTGNVIIAKSPFQDQKLFPILENAGVKLQKPIFH